MAKIPLLKKPVVKNILSALAVAFFGFILLNLAFMFDALFQGLIRALLGLFTPGDLFMGAPWFPPVMHVLFVILIGLISWFVFRSKLKVLFKAIYMTVPLAVVFVTIGMFLYPWPVISYLIGFFFGISLLYYFYRTKQPWLYYYAVILVGLTLAIFSLLGGEI
jgi:hypothetical protein